MDCSIIIVNWNTGNLLRKAIDALPVAFSNDETYEVFIIDNASSDQSMAIAEGSAQKYKPFFMKKNLGFSQANNVGIRQSTGEFVLLLNPDTEVTPGSLSALITFLKLHPKAAAVGPRLLNSDLTLQPSCRRFPSAFLLALQFLKIQHLIPNAKIFNDYFMRDFDYLVERPVDQIMGACMAIPRGVMDKIGLLDEKYWIWFEEVDWCFRAVNEGMEIWYSPAAEVVHHGGVSFKQAMFPIKKEWRFMRSALWYVKKHFGNGKWIFLMFLVPAGLLIDLITILPWYRQKRSK